MFYLIVNILINNIFVFLLLNRYNMQTDNVIFGVWLLVMTTLYQLQVKHLIL